MSYQSTRVWLWDGEEVDRGMNMGKSSWFHRLSLGNWPIDYWTKCGQLPTKSHKFSLFTYRWSSIILFFHMRLCSINLFFLPRQNSESSSGFKFWLHRSLPKWSHSWLVGQGWMPSSHELLVLFFLFFESCLPALLVTWKNAKAKVQIFILHCFGWNPSDPTLFG